MDFITWVHMMKDMFIDAKKNNWRQTTIRAKQKKGVKWRFHFKKKSKINQGELDAKKIKEEKNWSENVK